MPGIVFNPSLQGLAYARTDIGGAYKLNSDDTWTPLTDWANIGVRFDSAAAWAPDVGPTGLATLENKAVISVDQDGVAAGRIVDSGNGQVFSKRESDGDYVIALYNTSATATTTVSVPLSAAGISGSVTATNLWTGASAGSPCRCRGSLAAPVLHRQ